MKNEVFHPASHARMWQKTLCALSACAALSGAVQAEHHTYGWTGDLNLGFEYSTGEKRTRDINAALTLKHNKDFQASHPFRHIFKVVVDNQKTKEDNKPEKTSKDKDLVAYKLDYFLDQPSYIRGSLTYLHDIDLKVDEGKAASIRYIRKVLAESAHQLELGIGVVYFNFNFTDSASDIEGVGGLLSYEYTGQLTEHFSLNHTGMLKGNSDLRYGSLDTSLSYALTQNVSLSLTHNFSTVLSDNRDDKRDTTTHLTLGVKF